VALWGGALGAVMIATDGTPPRPENPWKAQGIGFLAMTLPVTLYFYFAKALRCRHRLASAFLGWSCSGKPGNGSRSRRRPFECRQFAPWEFGHTVAQQAAFSGDAGFPAWLWGPATIAFVGPMWWVVAIIATGRTPYDRWASARVALSG
jgi:hypothetical protein